MNLLSRILRKEPKPSDSVTVGFQKVLSNARSIADKHCNSYVGIEHIFLGILWLQDGVVIDAMKKLNVKIDSIREEVTDGLSKEDERQRPKSIPYTPVVKKIIKKGEKEAISLGHQNLAPEHLLLGILEVRSALSRKLDDAGLKSKVLRETVSTLTERSEHVGSHNSAGCAPSA